MPWRLWQRRIGGVHAAAHLPCGRARTAVCRSSGLFAARLVMNPRRPEALRSHGGSYRAFIASAITRCCSAECQAAHTGSYRALIASANARPGGQSGCLPRGRHLSGLLRSAAGAARAERPPAPPWACDGSDALRRHVEGYQSRRGYSAWMRKTFITSSPRWLITLTAMWPVSGAGKGRERSLWREDQASSSISALRVVLRDL